jgi:hypothetical protein
VVSSEHRILPLTCQQRCWRHLSRVLRLLLICPPLPDLYGLFVGGLSRNGGSREMPQSPVRWTSDRRLTRAGARQAHGRQTPPVCRCSLTHAAQEQSLPLAKGLCGSVLCRVSHSRHLCPSVSSSVCSPLPRILPATRMCGSCQRRPRQPIFPIPGRPQGGSPPSLRPRTSLRQHRPIHHIHGSKRTKHRRCRSIALGDYRCCRRHDTICRRTRAAQRCSCPST